MAGKFINFYPLITHHFAQKIRLFNRQVTKINGGIFNPFIV